MGTSVKIPKVSVLMPVYNGEKYLKEAIDSVLSQTFTDFEFLIINDGSKDKTKEILQAYTDPRIKIIDNETNLGLIKCLNKGIELAKGQYIARMDADDICMPERFQKQVEFLDKHSGICMVAAHIVFVDEKGEEAGYWREDMMTKSADEIRNMLPKENCIAHPTVMIRADVIKLAGYNKAFKNSEDWGLWLTLISQGKVLAKIDTILLKYRVHSSGTTVKANQTGPRKNIILYQYRYLKYKLSKLKLKGTDYKVVKSFLQHSIKYYFPYLYAFAGKIYSTNFIQLFSQYNSVRKYFAANNNSVTHIFFFPFYIVGGAEAIHAAILETIADKKPVAFITSKSGNTGLLAEYRKSAEVIDIYYLLVWPFAKRWLTKKLVNVCNNSKQVVLFSANSKYFYELLASVPAQTKAIDLIHAFVHEYEDGAEKWSLPVADKLATRVVINKKTINDIVKLYHRNHISDDLQARISCITNFVEAKKAPEKRMGGKVKVIYVGRGTAEKRIELISKAARTLAAKCSELEFHFVGDVKNAIPSEDLPYCILQGEIRDKTLLNKLYDESHILLITSSREGFPMSIMEAMMSGVVPVSTNVGGIPEHITDNVNGRLITATTNEEIVAESVKILVEFNTDRNKLKDMGLNAYNYALKNFDKKSFMDSYRKILTS